MNWRRLKTNHQGVLLVEIVLAVAVFGLICLIVISAFVYGRESTSIAGDNSRAAQVANGAVEAVRNIAQSSYSNLTSYTDGVTYYLNTSGTQWSLSTTPTVINGVYTPAVVFSAGPNSSRQVTVTVTWKENAQRTGRITSTTYLTNYTASTNNATIKSGLLVYANGGTTSNLISYRQLQSNGLWTSPQALPTAGASNYVPRSVKLYASQSTNAKMVLARYFDGTKQYLYGFYWNGNSWATPKLLAQWSYNGALDSGNFGGAWLANGTFMAAYSDNTNYPKFNTYANGAWSAQGVIGQVSSSQSVSPTSMTLAARPGTNEVMVAMLNSNYSTYTNYYANGAWTGLTIQASNGTTNGTHNVDFAWSEADGVHGALAFTKGSSDRTPSIIIFTADGNGGGSWGTPMSGPLQPSGSVVLSLAIAGQRGGSPNFIICDKDTQTNPHIYCYTASTTAVSAPTNSLIAAATAAGGQQSMDLGFEDTIGTLGMAGYSDNTAATKLKRFDSTTNTWDANPVSMPSASSVIQKTRMIPEPGLNDGMVLAIDNQNNLYSNMYNSSSNAFYTTPTGYAWTIHNANGPSTAAKWFDFGWDNL